MLVGTGTRGERLRLDALSNGLHRIAHQGLAIEHDFQAVVLRPVVAAGQHHPGAGIQIMRGKIQHRGGCHTDVHHVAPSSTQTRHQRLV